MPRPALILLLLFPALFLPACNSPAKPVMIEPAGSAFPTETPPDPNRGMLDIQTDPAGASISVDGKPAGVTPLVVKGLSIEHPLSVTITWPGVKPSTQTVDWHGHDLIQMRLKKSGGGKKSSR